MTQKMPTVSAEVAAPAKRPRVRLRRVDCNQSIPYPPDASDKEWWARLKKALGTTSSYFLSASLSQLMLATKLPFGGISETGMNAALAMIEAAAPRDEIEGALAVQMACTHAAAMSLLANLGMSNSEKRIACMASAAARLLRAYAMQVEALRRLRGKGEQLIRVEHFHVHEGEQPIVGSVNDRQTVLAKVAQ